MYKEDHKYSKMTITNLLLKLQKMPYKLVKMLVIEFMTCVEQKS